MLDCLNVEATEARNREDLFHDERPAHEAYQQRHEHGDDTDQRVSERVPKHKLGLRDTLRGCKQHEVRVHDADHLGTGVALDARHGKHRKRQHGKHRRDGRLSRAVENREQLELEPQEVREEQGDDERREAHADDRKNRCKGIPHRALTQSGNDSQDDSHNSPQDTRLETDGKRESDARTHHLGDGHVGHDVVRHAKVAVEHIPDIKEVR